MLENDAQLVRRVLLGDDSAFSTLVEKHQKGVHALVWRKVGDFHHAEEVTQDTFVQAYRKLGTLRDPNHFSGWLYVIANRLSINWVQRRKPVMQSLEETPVTEIEESSYKHYMTEKLQTETAEQRSEVVKNLLERLPESERTVVTLYYLGEMTAKEIGKYLGVSVNTIKSRLRRGRERLQESEPLVREMLGGVTLSSDLTQNVMHRVADINPIAPPDAKPTIPWAAVGAAAVVIVLMLGVGNQYLAHFQRPYSFEAQSEPTVEIVEAPIVLDILSKPSTRRQLGRIANTNENTGAGSQISEATLSTNGQEDDKFSTAQWMQTNAPPGGHVRDIFATAQGSVYAVSPTGIYKLIEDQNLWTRVNAGIPIDKSLMPTTEHHGTLYIVSTDKIFASTDNGTSWNAFCSRPKGTAVGLIITDTAEAENSDTDITLHLALRDEGIFRSTDAGQQWKSFNDGLIAERISAVAAIGKTVFAGTNSGLYRLNSDVWMKLAVGESNTVYSLTAHNGDLYAGVGPDLFGRFGSNSPEMGKILTDDGPHETRIFHSHNLGTSWTDITPKTEFRSALPSGTKVLAVGETLFALGATQFRSTDGGKNWTPLGRDPYAFMLNSMPSVAVNEQTFYKVGAFGIHRTTDAGESWHEYMDGVIGTRVIDLVRFNNRLYAYNGSEVFQSSDAGASWKNVKLAPTDATPESVKYDNADIKLDFDSRLLVDNNILYLVSPSEDNFRIFGLSADAEALIPIQGVPALESERVSPELGIGNKDTKPARLSEILSNPIEKSLKADTLTMRHDVLYVEYNRQLLKWKIGDTQWTHTRFVDMTEPAETNLINGFELAVSGKTIYVGRRDGKLFQSLDGGNSWRDITSSLSLRFNHFKEIVFLGSTVYVATDKGTLISATGDEWRVMTDDANARIVINHFTVDGHTIYGINDTAAYRLDTHGRWEQVATEIPDEIIALTTINNKLYAVTQQRGIFQMVLASVY